MSTFIGIDISSISHNIRIIDENCNQKLSYTISNNYEGFEELNNRLFDFDNIKIGFEQPRGPYKTLCSKLRGFYQYSAVRSNYKSLERVYRFVHRAWAKWLSRRSSKGKVLYDELKENYPLPRPRIIHSV